MKVTIELEVPDTWTGPYFPKEGMDVWGFVANFYPDYERCDEIAYEGDLTKILNNEWEEGDCAYDLWLNEFNQNIEKVSAEQVVYQRDIFETAIQGFINCIKKIDNGK